MCLHSSAIVMVFRLLLSAWTPRGRPAGPWKVEIWQRCPMTSKTASSLKPVKPVKPVKVLWLLMGPTRHTRHLRIVPRSAAGTLVLTAVRSDRDTYRRKMSGRADLAASGAKTVRKGICRSQAIADDGRSAECHNSCPQSVREWRGFRESRSRSSWVSFCILASSLRVKTCHQWQALAGGKSW